MFLVIVIVGYLYYCSLLQPTSMIYINHLLTFGDEVSDGMRVRRHPSLLMLDHVCLIRLFVSAALFNTL